MAKRVRFLIDFDFWVPPNSRVVVFTKAGTEKLIPEAHYAAAMAEAQRRGIDILELIEAKPAESDAEAERLEGLPDGA